MWHIAAADPPNDHNGGGYPPANQPTTSPAGVSSSSDSSSTSVVAGAIIGSVVVFLTCVILPLVICCRRMQSSSPSTRPSTPRVSSSPGEGHQSAEHVTLVATGLLLPPTEQHHEVLQGVILGLGGGAPHAPPSMPVDYATAGYTSAEYITSHPAFIECDEVTAIRYNSSSPGASRPGTVSTGSSIRREAWTDVVAHEMREPQLL